MLDLRIRGAFVVDGTGSPRQRADIGIREGRIVAIGDVDVPAARTLDADGLVVTPGFIDLHTHYDAQVLWDPACTPSPLHGVTSIFGGNCGFTLAPIAPTSVDYVTRMLARVEGMSLATLQEGVSFEWSTFGEYLGAMEGNLSVNAGFLVGHSTIRRVVMGEDSVERPATNEELDAMRQLLRRSIADGGLGFSSSQGSFHYDWDGKPVPSLFATDDEILALCEVVGEFPGTTIGFIGNQTTSRWTEQTSDLITRMSVVADRPVNWNVLIPSKEHSDETWGRLEITSYAAERGGLVRALVAPSATEVFHNFETAFALSGIPGWRETMFLSSKEKLRALQDPTVREKLAAGHAQLLAVESGRRRALFDWSSWRVVRSRSSELAGRTIAEIANERGSLTSLDCVLDIAVADELETVFLGLRNNHDDEWQFRKDVWSDPGAIIGGSDAGAHLDMLADFNYTTKTLAACRDLDLLDFETAVHQLTDIPARLYGLRNRGRIEVGAWADLVILDEATVGSGPTRWQTDLPAGGGRLVAEATGIHSVLVNGVEIVHGQELTGNTPGLVIRPGRDTETVLASAHCASAG